MRAVIFCAQVLTPRRALENEILDYRTIGGSVERAHSRGWFRGNRLVNKSGLRGNSLVNKSGWRPNQTGKICCSVDVFL